MGESPMSSEYLRHDRCRLHLPNKSVGIYCVWEKRFCHGVYVARSVSPIPFIKGVLADYSFDECDRALVIAGAPPAHECGLFRKLICAFVPY